MRAFPLFDFNLNQNSKTLLIYQKPPNKLKKFLKKKYSSENSSSAQMDKSLHRKKHGDRFIRNLKKTLKKKKFKNNSFLEIGCGSGYILKKLKAEGSNVVGIEPGKKINKSNNTKILNSFFEKINFNKKFDYIINNAVLEHQINPIEFLKKVKKDLKLNGYTFICVPDYEKQLKSGDPTLMNHEHISYFTKKTLKTILRISGFSKVKTFNDGLGNLYGVGRNLKQLKVSFEYKISKDKNLAKIYFLKFSKTINKIEKWLKLNLKDNLNLGLYGATSSITNIFSLIKHDKNKIFIFDTDQSKQNKYINGFSNPVMHPREIKKRRICKIIILPLYYEKEIKDFLKKSINYNSKKIINLSQFTN